METKLFAVIRERGPQWDHARPLEDQPEWQSHAAYMDALVDRGFIVLGGPLQGTSRVLLIVRAQDEAEVNARLAADSSTQIDLLRTVSVAPWTLRLGTLP